MILCTLDFLLGVIINSKAWSLRFCLLVKSTDNLTKIFSKFLTHLYYEKFKNIYFYYMAILEMLFHRREAFPFFPKKVYLLYDLNHIMDLVEPKEELTTFIKNMYSLTKYCGNYFIKFHFKRKEN